MCFISGKGLFFACLLACLLGLLSALFLSLEWVTSLPSNTLLGVESDIHQNKAKPFGPPPRCPLDLPLSIALALTHTGSGEITRGGS